MRATDAPNGHPEAPIRFVYSPAFDDPKMEKDILGPEPEGVRNDPIDLSKEMDGYLRSLYQMPLLTKEQELYLFRRMNYDRYKADTLRAALCRCRAIDPVIELFVKENIEQHLDDATHIHDRIVNANLRLVVFAARKYIGKMGLDFDQHFWEFVSDGNVALMRMVNAFNYANGNKFSTYTFRGLFKTFTRPMQNDHTFADHHTQLDDEVWDAQAAPPHCDERTYVRHIGEVRSCIKDLLPAVPGRTRKMIIEHAGVNENAEFATCYKRKQQTLDQLGDYFDSEKQNIQQIIKGALPRMEKYAKDHGIKEPELIEVT